MKVVSKCKRATHQERTAMNRQTIYKTRNDSTRINASIVSSPVAYNPLPIPRKSKVAE